MNERQIDKLLAGIARGDNAALEELYAKTSRGVYSFLYSYLKNRERTEDALQTVYLKVKLNADSYRPGTNGRAWLLQIAKNQALNDVKANRRVEYTDIPEASVSPPTCGVVTDTMNRVLSEEERYIVNLHVLWGYKHREIAEQLGCPTGTVTSKYKRSISKLKEALKEVEK